MIQLNDLFHTVQGEGFNVGRRALFVRMPYCNLACSWCDTQFNSFKEWDPQQIVEFAGKEPTRFAVITGGEPTMHKHTPRVIEILLALNFQIAIETNGHFPIPDGIGWVCCSPKRDTDKISKAPYFVHSAVWPLVSEFKYVVDDDFDFSILERHASDNADHSMFLVRHWLSPEHTNWQRNVQRILGFISENPEWRLNLQTHKLVGVP